MFIEKVGPQIPSSVRSAMAFRSFLSLLTELRAVPTIEMSIQLSADTADSTFEWVLVRASTTSADAHGFVRETIDIWTEEGLHLASCTQLRIVR